MLQSIILLVVLIFLNATFASAEIAVISVNPSKLKKMSQEGNKKASRLVSLTEQPAKFLATIQVAITLAGFLQSAFAAESFAGPLVSLLVRMGVSIPESILKTASIVIITIILGYFNLVFGELIPKRVAMKKSESMALGMSGMLYGVSKVFAPLVWLLTASTNGIIRLLGMNPDENDEQVTEEEIRMMLDEGSQQGTIQEEETEIIQNVFEFNDTEVDSLATHRPDVIMLDMRDSDEEWHSVILENRHSFYPICGESSDDIIGILDTKDYFRLEDKSRDNLLKSAVTPPYFVPESMRANILFRKMKEIRTYFAVVMDEYGSVSGIITLHDLLESLVGDITEDEENDVPDIIKAEDCWVIQGKADLSDVAEELGAELPLDSYDTFNGYVCDIIGRIPDNKESFSCENELMVIDVKTVENHIIGEAYVTLKQKEENPEEV